MRSIVVAYDTERAIGRDGGIPWLGKLPVDMRMFRSITERQAVIMGRRTFESLPEAFRPLPNRRNIVMTMSQQALEGVTIVDSLPAAYEAAGRDSFVIGGAQVYQQALSTTDRVYATEIRTRIENPDAFFPALSVEEWVETAERPFDCDDRNRYSGRFVIYTRRELVGKPYRAELRDKELAAQVQATRTQKHRSS